MGGAGGVGVGEISMPGMAAPKPTGAGPLIVDLAEEEAKQAQAAAAAAAAVAPAATAGTSGAKKLTAEPSAKKKGKPTVKKGFLTSNPKLKKEGTKMYPEGSNEGLKQHPWNSIMHKSKVIDLNDCTPEQQAKYAAGSRDPKDFVPQPSTRGKEEAAEAARRAQFSDAEFERMMEKMEPDTFGADAARRVAKEREAGEEMAKWADMFAQSDKRIDGAMGKQGAEVAGGGAKEPLTKEEGEKQASEMLSMLGSLMGEGAAAEQAQAMVDKINTSGLGGLGQDMPAKSAMTPAEALKMMDASDAAAEAEAAVRR